MSGGGNTSPGKSAKPGKPARTERLAQQLRANLKKRKAAARAQATADIAAGGARTRPDEPAEP